MNHSQASIPFWIERKSHSALLNVLAVIGGSILLAILAHISIPLPFTPVPITGQTFGVAFLALSLGSARATSAFALYLLEGLAGLPVFAMAIGGSTIGYLFGMLVASALVGYLADKGFARTIPKAFLCCLAGSACVFGFGILGLSYFLPPNLLLQSGLLPFIPGDLIKNLLAATLASGLSHTLRSRES